LLRKGAVYSATTTWRIRAGPVVTLATMFGALCLVPFGGNPALLHFEGDVLLMAYLFALGRFFTNLAALDTGSSFEGMGGTASVFLGAERARFCSSGGLGAITGSVSLSEIYDASGTRRFWLAPSAMIFILAAFVIVYLTRTREFRWTTRRRTSN
jgi:formate hydrogenlyase subunit 4